MAKDVKLIIGGDTRGADAAIASLTRSGQQAASLLEREFNQLGVKSSLAFENQRDAATKAFEKIKSSGLATADELARAQKAHAEKMAQLDEEQFGKRTSLLEKFKSNWLAITATMAAAGVAAVKAFDLAEQGAKFQQAGTSFANLAAASGSSADKMIADLRRVTGETVSVQQLVEKAGTAMLLGVEIQAIPKLAEIAKASSKITGQSVTEAFGDLSLAVARQSKMILDNLGIMVDIEKANADYAASLGKTALELTDAEKKQAFLNATMAEGQQIIDKLGTSAETDADKMAKFRASLDNIGNSIGILLSGPMADLAAEMSATVGWLEAYRGGQIGFWEWATTGADEAAEKLKKINTTRFDATVSKEGMERAKRLQEAEAKKTADAVAKANAEAATKAAAEREKRLAEIAKHNVKLIDVEKKRIAEIQKLETDHLSKMTTEYGAAVERMQSILATQAATQATFAQARASLNPVAQQTDPFLQRMEGLDRIAQQEAQINNDWSLSAEERAQKLAELATLATSYKDAVVVDGVEIISQLSAEATARETIERLQRTSAALLESEAERRADAAQKALDDMTTAQNRVQEFTGYVQNLDTLLERMNNKEINIIFRAQNVGQLTAAGGVSGLPGTAVDAPIMGGMPTAHTGTAYVPKTGLYQLARGEAVLNRNETQRAEQPAAAPVTIAPTINVSVPAGSNVDARELARLLTPELQRLAKRVA